MLQVSGKCFSNRAGNEPVREGATLDRSLAAYIRDEPADSTVLPVFRRVLEALNAIHGIGASHQPLSPRTIRFDDSGQPQIRLLQRPHENADTVAFGAAKYSAPEAFVNAESPSCESADCYVLGFMFYEILLGRKSFSAQFASVENGPSSLWLKWHADRTAKALALSEVRPNLGNLARLIDGMIEKDPRRRPNSLSQVLAEFANFDAQTAYHMDSHRQPATMPSPPDHFKLVRTKVAFTAAWFRTRLGALRERRIRAGLLMLAAVLGMTAVLVNRRSPSRHVSQTLHASRAPVAQLSTKATTPVTDAPPARRLDLAAPPVAPEPGSELQIESRLSSGAFLVLDGLRPVHVSPHSMFREEITPGTHELRLLTGSKGFLKFPLSASADGVSVLEPPASKSLHYVVLVSSAKSGKLYASPEARAGLPGQPYERVPEEGRLVANDKVVAVAFSQDPRSEVHVDPSPGRSMRIIIEPGELRPLIPVEITANVSDASIVINGEKLTRQLAKGVTVVGLHPGEYHVKLVHPNYQDSAEQELVIDGNARREEMAFTLFPIMRQSSLVVSSLAAGAEVLVDGKALGTANSSAGFSANVNPGMHTVTFRRQNFEDFTIARDFPAGGAVSMSGQGMRALARIMFHVVPANAQIICRRESDSETKNCSNNQPCFLRAGAYDVTARAGGFKTEVNRIALGTGDDKPYEWKLEAIPLAWNPVDFFEDGQTWTIDASGWWSHTQPGYSFIRAKQGTFVFDIVKPSGFLASNKVLLVVNYRGDGNRVLYTMDAHKLYRSERAPGLTADFSVAHEIPADTNYRLALELSPDRVIIRNGAGKTLDDLPLVNAANGKVGFAGKVKLKIIQAGYSQ
jgi:hypothetical protein